MRIFCTCGATSLKNSCNSKAPKNPINVSINSDLLEKSKDINIILSATLEPGVAEQLRCKHRAHWLRENADAIQAYNQFVESKGTFSDTVRKF